MEILALSRANTMIGMHPRFHDLLPTSTIAFRRVTLFKLTDKILDCTSPWININRHRVSPIVPRFVSSWRFAINCISYDRRKERFLISYIHLSLYVYLSADCTHLTKLWIKKKILSKLLHKRGKNVKSGIQLNLIFTHYNDTRSRSSKKQPLNDCEQS